MLYSNCTYDSDGTRNGGVNRDGIKYYNDLINQLLSNG